MKTLFIITGVLLFLNITACKKDGPTEPIESTWKEEEPNVLAFARNNFENLQFGTSVFRLTLDCFSDVPSSPCEPQTYKWKEYVSGTFRFSTDSLYFEGDFTDAKFKINSKECHREGKYKMAFKFSRPNDGTLILDPDKEPYYTIVLKKIK